MTKTRFILILLLTATLISCGGKNDPEALKPCTPPNALPCQNGGTCYENKQHLRQCKCPEGFTGALCEKAKENYCNTINLCLNGGKCKPVYTPELFKCDCVNGYTGSVCEIEPAPNTQCSPNPCQHGTCSPNGSTYTCNCDKGYSGTNCDKIVSPIPCSPNPCQHGTCTPSGTTYTCLCNSGYEGTNCDKVKVAPVCSPNPCQHGTCSPNGTTYACSCDNGYSGTNCEYPDGSGPFKIKVKVTNPSLTFHIGINPTPIGSIGGLVPMHSPGHIPHYSYNVDCDSDGTLEASNLSTSYDCKYSNPGEYIISIRGDYSSPAFYCDHNPGQILEVINWGSQIWETMEAAFQKCTELTSVGNTKPNLSKVNFMSSMFEYASKFNSNIDFWDVSHITNMSLTFRFATKFNQPLNHWNTSNVKNMIAMFSHAQAFNQPLNNWNTSHVTDMTAMFYETKAFDQPINSWNTSNVTDMREMFYGAAAFDQPLNNWNTSNVKNMSEMFEKATSFNQNISNWNTSAIPSGDCQDFDKGATAWQDSHKFPHSHCDH